MQLRALIIRPGALGDTMVTLPALADLEGRADVVFVGRRPGLPFLVGHIADALDFELSGWHGLFSATTPDIRAAVSPPDVVAAFMADREGRVRRNLARLYPRAGVRLFPSLPDDGRAGHVARYMAECLVEAGLPVDPDRVMTRCRETPLLARGSSPKGREKLVLHPGSGSVSKNHPVEFWFALLKRLLKEQDFSHLESWVLVGPAEIDSLSAWESEFQDRDVQFMVRPDHAGLGEIMETAALYVGHDSGISHLAAMFGVPTVALFKSSRPDRWRPLGPFVRVISSREADAGLEKKIMDAGQALLSRAHP